eukprot:2501678-Rhodomonas_salina.1
MIVHARHYVNIPSAQQQLKNTYLRTGGTHDEFHEAWVVPNGLASELDDSFAYTDGNRRLGVIAVRHYGVNNRESRLVGIRVVCCT